MSANLTVPAAIEAVIQNFDGRSTAFDEHAVSQALNSARTTLHEPTAAENYGAWAEVLAFALSPSSRHNPSPWRTFFGPMGSGTDNNGKTIYFPDIGPADADVIAHWSKRATSVRHPILKARYADLAWDMCIAIANMKREVAMARLAIDAYLASAPIGIRDKDFRRFKAVLRALDLAVMIGDQERTTFARQALLYLHSRTVSTRKGNWRIAFDRLATDKKTGVTDAELQQLVADLEDLVSHFADTSDPAKFNPHELEDAAKRLILHYRRLRRPSDAKRLHESIGRAFEHFASLGDAMLASSVLQTSVNAYREAGLGDESERVRVLMQEKIGQSHDEMKPIQTEFKISQDDVESFLHDVVVDSIGSTFARIAIYFLPKRSQLERTINEIKESAPLLAHLPQVIVSENHVAGKVGSVDEDMHGRLIQQATLHLNLSTFWLDKAIRRTLEKHDVKTAHFVGWLNRGALVDDVSFLNEGVQAWYEGDFVKAIHVLVPQLERCLRGIVSKLGKPVTKAHATVTGVSVAIGMGDILYSEELSGALGPNITLYLLALYADPRGMNLRNEVAHGLVKPDRAGEGLVLWLLHTLLIFGMWEELAKSRG